MPLVFGRKKTGGRLVEIVKDVAAVIGCILSLFSLIALTSKSGRAFVQDLFKRNTQDLRRVNQQQSSDIKAIKKDLETVLKKFDALEEVSKQQCRNTIKNIYYKYQKEKKIPLYERKTADKTYDIYSRIFKGNSYATLLHNEITKWEIDTISFQDLEED